MDFEKISSIAAADAAYLVNDNCAIIYASAKDTAAGAGIVDAIVKELGRRNIEAKAFRTGSMGYYDLEPLLVVAKPGQPHALYANVAPDTADDLVADYLLDGDKHGFLNEAALPFFKLQKRLVSADCGYIDPADINHAVVRGKAYSGLAAALEMEPTGIVDRLRRADDMAPTADRWQSCLEAEGHGKYLVCNAFDADPGALTARLLLGSDPHAVLEGMLIGAFACGASRCFICIAAGGPPDAGPVSRAIDQMRAYGLVGPRVLHSDFGVEIEVCEIEPSLVLSEETALLRALEGRQARPYLRIGQIGPCRCQDHPTVVDDAETFASVSGIFRNGPEWLAAIGADRGTKIVTVTDGDKRITVEVPPETTLRALVEGAGLWDRREVQAVRLGGCTGAFFPADDLEIPLTGDTAGSPNDPGVVEIIRRGACPVALAQEAVTFLQGQSCGQCVFCREGTLQMGEILGDIAGFKGHPGDLELLEELGELMKDGCICGLGSAAPDPVLSSMRHFRRDFENHLNEKRCLVDGRV